MGGFVGNKESVEGAASRILEKLTGMHDVYMDQLYCFGEVSRDRGGRVVSVAYYALININQYPKDLLEKHKAKWFDARSVPALVFDHKKTIKMAIGQLKEKADSSPPWFCASAKAKCHVSVAILY